MQPPKNNTTRRGANTRRHHCCLRAAAVAPRAPVGSPSHNGAILQAEQTAGGRAFNAVVLHKVADPDAVSREQANHNMHADTAASGACRVQSGFAWRACWRPHLSELCLDEALAVGTFGGGAPLDAEELVPVPEHQHRRAIDVELLARACIARWENVRAGRRRADGRAGCARPGRMQGHASSSPVVPGWPKADHTFGQVLRPADSHPVVLQQSFTGSRGGCAPRNNLPDLYCETRSLVGLLAVQQAAPTRHIG